MRAYAALAVVLIHAGGAGFRELGIIGNNIANLGRAGVYVFFVISGFSVASSYETSKDYPDYTNKRLWRIAPLYYFWIAVSAMMAVFFYEDTNIDISTYNLLMHFSFLSFLDYRIANSIMSVEWTIPIEVFWYITLPILMTLSNNGKKTILFLITSLVLYNLCIKYQALLPVPKADAGRAMHYSPLPYLISYALGVTAYRVRPLISESAQLGNTTFCLIIILLILYATHPSAVLMLFYDELVFSSTITFAVIISGTNQSPLIRWTLNNRAIQFLGVISYGIYLAHVPVIGFLSHINFVFIDVPFARFAISTPITIAVATITYLLIEKRGIDYGRRFSSWYKFRYKRS